MKHVSLDPKVVLNGRKTFYTKRSQNNGFYPINKFVWNDELGAWEQFVKKTSGWHSWGCAYKDPITTSDGKVIDNISWWEYIFTHNSFIISYNEMKDEKSYDDK